MTHSRDRDSTQFHPGLKDQHEKNSFGFRHKLPTRVNFERIIIHYEVHFSSLVCRYHRHADKRCRGCSGPDGEDVVSNIHGLISIAFTSPQPAFIYIHYFFFLSAFTVFSMALHQATPEAIPSLISNVLLATSIPSMGRRSSIPIPPTKT